MRLLLDTHALIWFLAADTRLPRKVRAEIENPETKTLVSAVSAMEVTTKHRLGKLPQAEALALAFEQSIELHGFEGLPITLRHAEVAGRLPVAHKDPFDRLLIAQAVLEDLVLVSNEAPFDAFGVARFW